MKNIYLEILKENQLVALPEVRPREFLFEPIPQTALALIGPRRAGKTMLVKQIALNLMKVGVTAEQVIYVNFFDERMSQTKAEDLGLILEAYFELNPHANKNTEKYFFFDEIQVVEGWEKFASRLIRDNTNHVYVTGSSAHLLSKEIATEMRGRAISYEIFPLSFKEFLNWNDTAPSSVTAEERGKLGAAFNKYFQAGGFPATFGLQAATNLKLLQDYYSVAIYKDVIERNNASKPLLIDALCKLLLNQPATFYTLNKLANKLKAQGYSCSSSELSQYISWLEDSYLLLSIPMFAESEQKKRVNPRKVYCVDHALAKAVSTNVSENSGHLLENIVFMHLRRKHSRIYYYKTKDGSEVDLAYLDQQNKLSLLQVSLAFNDEHTKVREVSSLLSACAETMQKHAQIITLNHREKLTEGGITIDIVPVYEFLLNIT